MLITITITKCKILHIGHKFDIAYKMAISNNILKLNDSNGDRDLGIMVTTYK